MENFDKGCISSQLMQLVYKYDKPLIEVLSDLNKLNEDPDVLDPIVVLEDYYNEQKRR